MEHTTVINKAQSGVERLPFHTVLSEQAPSGIGAFFLSGQGLNSLQFHSCHSSMVNEELEEKSRGGHSSSWQLVTAGLSAPRQSGFLA
jgi:hypothetical protein